MRLTARKYTEMLALPPTDLEKLIASRFKHAIADAETQNQLLWDDTEMTLSQMVQKAEQVEDYRGCDNVKPKKSLRTMELLQKQVSSENRKRSYKNKFPPYRPKQKGTSLSRRKPFICWNCEKT